MMRNLWLIAKADFKNLITNPMWVFYATAFPLLLVMIIGYLTKGAYGNGFSSYDYYGVTLIIYSALSSGMTAANAFMEERIKKPNMRIIYAPGNVKSLFLAKIGASFVFSFLTHIVDFAILSLVFGIEVKGVGQLLVLLGLTELFSVTLGITMCCVIKQESMTNQLQSIIINLLAVLGGVLFSLDGFGGTVRKISMISPVKWIVNAAFQIIYDRDSHLLLPAAGFLAGCIIIMTAVCCFTFRKEDCIC